MDFTNEKCVMLIDDSLPLGLIEFPIPILKAPPGRIKAIREALYEDAALSYLGIALCGNKKKMNKLTGSLPLLR